MDFENIVNLVDKNKNKLNSGDYLKIMNSLKKIYDSTIKTKIESKKEIIIESDDEDEDYDFTYYSNENEDTYASLYK